MSESWKVVWRKAIAPLLSLPALEAIRKALEDDDPRLKQKQTTEPPPMSCVSDWPCEGACLIGFAGWQGDGLVTVGEVEQFFARCCWMADLEMGTPGDVRFLVNWWDTTSREEAIRELLPEVVLAIETKQEREKNNEQTEHHAGVSN